MQKKIRQVAGWIIIGLLVLIVLILLGTLQAWTLWVTWNKSISLMLDLPQVEFFAPFRAFWGIALTVITWKWFFSNRSIKSTKKQNKESK